MTNWNLAALPNKDGVVVSRLHADNFRILKDTKNPEAAFKVLSYMLNEGALDLLNVYGAMPARTDLRDAYFEGLDENFTQGVNWHVFLDGLDYPDNPSHQANMTKFVEIRRPDQGTRQPLIIGPEPRHRRRGREARGGPRSHLGQLTGVRCPSHSLRGGRTPRRPPAPPDQESSPGASVGGGSSSCRRG